MKMSRHSTLFVFITWNEPPTILILLPYKESAFERNTDNGVRDETPILSEGRILAANETELLLVQNTM